LLNYDGRLSLQGTELVLGNGDVVWPRGFSARLLNGKAELVGPDGTVIAREGDHLEGQILGGYHGDGQFHVDCVSAVGLEWGPWGCPHLDTGLARCKRVGPRRQSEHPA
jgi:hypothetical protein